MHTSVDDLLREAGWLPGREVDVAEVVAALTAAGFAVSEAADAFLRKYHGLEITHDPCLEINGREMCTKTVVEPLAVATHRDAEFARRCSRVAEAELCPVATDSFHLTVYMSPDGRLWGGKDSFVYAYAENERQFFEKMVDGERPRKIGEWQTA